MDLDFVTKNQDFLLAFAKVYENVEIREVEELSESLNEIYNGLKRNNKDFETTYLRLRRSILDSKDKFKEERKQLAIVDPAKFAEMKLNKNKQTKSNKMKKVKRSETFNLGINKKIE